MKLLESLTPMEKHIVVVKIGGNAHVMDESELRWVYGCLHPEKWKRGA